jgi:hypothetical protein
MDTISHLNLAINGFPFQKITYLFISHEPNQHAYAKIIGEVDAGTAQDSLQRVDERTMVTITTTADGQPSELFCGCVANVSLEQDNAYSNVTLELCSLSRMTDTVKKKKTYQNTKATYGQIISKNISDLADFHMMVSDKAIGALIMQYEETDWEFAKRMASKLKAPLIANVSSARPQIYMGLPDASRIISEDSLFFGYGNDAARPSEASEAMAQDFSSTAVQSYAYGYLGDRILFNGKSSVIKSVRAELRDGILKMNYGLMEGAGASGGSLAGIAVPQTANVQASGKMMKGRVQAVQGDKVQVFLTSVDQSYDSGGDWWFPFSTSYSSGDGSGWYCMPEEEDEVLVFFPSGNEGEAFAASSVCASPPANPRNKSWKAPGGKEILLTDEGMYIIGNSGKIFINLTDKEGIEIHSDKNINISSEAKVNITSSKEMSIVAKNQVVIGTEGAYLEITEGSATLAAEEVLIN